MSNIDQQGIVQAKLGSGENAVAEASLMQGWVRTSRILALVEHDGNHVLFVFLSSRVPPQTFSDLTIERILPIDSEFRCEIDPDSKHQDGVDVYVNISSRKVKLLFEMMPGVKTSSFVGEIFRVIEVFTKRRGPPPDFQWLQKYTGHSNRDSSGSYGSLDGDAVPDDKGDDGLQQDDSPGTSRALSSSYLPILSVPPSTEKSREIMTFYMKSSQGLLELESPDISVPRQSIAKGATPIAARESVIRYQMAMKEHHYTYTQVLRCKQWVIRSRRADLDDIFKRDGPEHLYRIFIGTWNVNGQPPTIPLHDWLAQDPEPPDIYAIGFQELDLSKEAFLFNDTPREEEWQAAVMNSLHPKARYHKVALVRLVGMMLLIFVQEQHVAYVRAVATETVGTGIMGKMGNKGGVGVRFDLHSTSICFVNSHLAAHVEEYERRNQDFHDICSRMSFTRFLPPKGIKDHDQIYWLGDLNYRITDMDPKLVKDHIEQNDFHPILKYDQLHQQHNIQNVFVGYKEGTLTFRPTYKYDPGTDNWDSSEKNRAPAWCDRILWKGDGIEQIAYRSHPELKISDHKPVSALFNSQIRVIDTVKYRKIHEEVMKKLDKLENEFLPQVMVDNTEIIFDTVQYLESQTKDLIIANTGQVPVTFEFIKKLDDSSYCKDWLNIEPYAGFIMPGEKCDIKLEVFVDKKSAFKLNSGEDKLYDILVLHLEGGKDIFITVTGTYQRSCFGSSIEALVYISVPVREIPVGRLMELALQQASTEKSNHTTHQLDENSKEITSSQDPYPIPKEIWFLVDHLYRHGLKQAHLFEQPGLHSELLQIRNWLDNGSPDPLPGSVHSVAEALLLLLESTAEPIIPYNLHNICLGASSNYLQCKQIVMQLPEHRKNVFLYLCAFLQEVLSHMTENGLDAKTVATLFGTIFLRDPPRSRGDHTSRARTNQQALDRKKASFVYHFLVNDQSDFILGR